MISRCTHSVPKEDDSPRLLHCDSRWSQSCCWRSEACYLCTEPCRRCSQVLPGAPEVPSCASRWSQTCHNHSHGTSVPVIRDLSYSEGCQRCHPRVWYSPEIDASKFTLHILSVTPGGSQWLKYILLMKLCFITWLNVFTPFWWTQMHVLLSLFQLL